MVLVKAYSIFKDEKYLTVAKSAAEAVWQRGLLRKGLSICHGVGGNGFVFLKLWEATKVIENDRNTEWGRTANMNKWHYDSVNGCGVKRAVKLCKLPTILSVYSKELPVQFVTWKHV
jgi:hypothetical protein